MPIKRIPYWSLSISQDEWAVVRDTIKFFADRGSDEDAADLAKAVLESTGEIISISREGLLSCESAIDRWAIDGRPDMKMARVAGRLCCRIQMAGRCAPSGYVEVDSPELAPVAAQRSLFD